MVYNVLFIANNSDPTKVLSNFLFLFFLVIDGEGYNGGVTAMDTSPGAGGIMRGGIYHPTPPHNITDQQVGTFGLVMAICFTHAITCT